MLFATFLFTGIFFKWALGPFKYEKAHAEEKLGHQLAKKGKAAEASKHFLAAAQIEDDNISTSRRYRCAASTSQNENDKIKYFLLALKYNPDNKIAKLALNPLLESNIKYSNRWRGGWSKGKKGTAILNIKEKSMTFLLTYFTSNPVNKNHVIKMFLDGNLYAKKNIVSRKSYSESIEVGYGMHTVDILISSTFNPKKLGISKDDRELGVKFSIHREITTSE